MRTAQGPDILHDTRTMEEAKGKHIRDIIERSLHFLANKLLAPYPPSSMNMLPHPGAMQSSSVLAVHPIKSTPFSIIFAIVFSSRGSIYCSDPVLQVRTSCRGTGRMLPCQGRATTSMVGCASGQLQGRASKPERLARANINNNLQSVWGSHAYTRH